jgi:hypothetical protein
MSRPVSRPVQSRLRSNGRSGPGSQAEEPRWPDHHHQGRFSPRAGDQDRGEEAREPDHWFGELAALSWLRLMPCRLRPRRLCKRVRMRCRSKSEHPTLIRWSCKYISPVAPSGGEQRSQTPRPWDRLLHHLRQWARRWRRSPAPAAPDAHEPHPAC